MERLVETAKRIMIWILPISVGGAFLMIQPFGLAAGLAEELVELARGAENPSVAMEALSQQAAAVDSRSIQLRYFFDVSQREDWSEAFTTQGGWDPESWYAGSWSPNAFAGIPDEEKAYNFRIKLARLQELAKPHLGTLDTVGELDEIITPKIHLPYGEAQFSPGFSILVLALMLAGQMLYLGSIANTISVYQDRQAVDLQSWIFFNESKVALPLGYIWLGLPSVLLLVSASRYALLSGISKPLSLTAFLAAGTACGSAYFAIRAIRNLRS